MGPPSEVTGGIFQDLASFAIFFDPREAHFCSFWGRMSPKLYVGFLVRHVPFRVARAPLAYIVRHIELRRFPKFQVHILKTDSGKNP